MPTIYVRSTDGNNADDGSTWALAKADLTGAAAIDAAGDTIYVSDAHAETTASAISFSFAGTHAAPTRVICGDDAAEPPTTATATGSITTTGTSQITWATVYAGKTYAYGLIFECGTGAGNTFISLGLTNVAQFLEFENCKFRMNVTGTAARILCGTASEDRVVWKNCAVKFAAAGQAINPCSSARASFVWDGGSLESGGTSPTSLFKPSAFMTDVLVTGVDLSNASAGINLIDGGSTSVAGKIVFRNCKLPASWSGALLTGRGSVAQFRAELWNCDAGDTTYNVQVSDYAADLTTETSIYRSGGASDGTTNVSWKVATTANCDDVAFVTPEIVKRNTTTGSAITLTIDVVRDDATGLTDAEVWIEANYLGTSGAPLGTFIADDVAGSNSGNILASATTQTSSSATWTGTGGFSNENKQKLSVSFTPQEAGYIIARVHVKKASATLYIDPDIQVS